MDGNTHSIKWSTGRVIETHRGEDQVTRVVIVKYANGLFENRVSYQLKVKKKITINKICSIGLV